MSWLKFTLAVGTLIFIGLQSEEMVVFFLHFFTMAKKLTKFISDETEVYETTTKTEDKDTRIKARGPWATMAHLSEQQWLT